MMGMGAQAHKRTKVRQHALPLYRSLFYFCRLRKNLQMRALGFVPQGIEQHFSMSLKRKAFETEAPPRSKDANQSQSFPNTPPRGGCQPSTLPTSMHTSNSGEKVAAVASCKELECSWTSPLFFSLAFGRRQRAGGKSQGGHHVPRSRARDQCRMPSQCRRVGHSGEGNAEMHRVESILGPSALGSTGEGDDIRLPALSRE